MTDLRPAFLLSLPRSGSTLVQRMLAAHSAVATVAEPWLLLPPLYALRPDGVYAEYGHRVTVSAIEDMTSHLPGGRADYLDAVRTMAMEVYTRLSPPEARVFLDKTPRYGLIVEELLDTFPDSSFVILHRNPLAVVSSIVTSFMGGAWKPYHHKQDLYLLAERLLAAQESHPERFTVVRYEDVIDQPRDTLTRVLEALGLEWEDRMLDSAGSDTVEGVVGDRTGVTDYDRVSSEPLTKWQGNLDSPIRRSWARRYLQWLGRERLDLMGYDLDALQTELDDLPIDYAKLPGDLANTARGLIWSIMEVESLRAKLRGLTSWRELFTHT